jgi:Phosphodiester glycosidase
MRRCGTSLRTFRDGTSAYHQVSSDSFFEWKYAPDSVRKDGMHFCSWVSLPRSATRFGAPLILILCSVAFALALPADPDWQTLAPGMELRYYTPPQSGLTGDGRILILRMDAKLWELVLLDSSQAGDSEGHTARAWCAKYNLAAAINGGMYATDHKTHVGYMRSVDRVNNSKPNNYQSVAAFSPRDNSLPPFRMFDLDASGVSLPAILKDYGSVVQNLRLIKRAGVNAWPPQPKRWSEAALGEDDHGRILFIFSRTPFSMHDLNQALLSAGIGLVAAQHLDGGPPAQFYLHVGKTEKELLGSYESAFQEAEDNAIPLPMPLVLGVRPRTNAAR